MAVQPGTWRTWLIVVDKEGNKQVRVQVTTIQSTMYHYVGYMHVLIYRVVDGDLVAVVHQHTRHNIVYYGYKTLLFGGYHCNIEPDLRDIDVNTTTHAELNPFQC